MVIVPHIVPEVPALRVNPVIAYLSDHFQRPTPFQPSVVVDVESVLERVIDQLVCHRSQFFEWLPYTMCQENAFPPEAAAQREYTKQFYCQFNGPLADRYRDVVIKTYGESRGAKIRYIEAFEPCEYGSPLTEEARRRLFPMWPYPGSRTIFVSEQALGPDQGHPRSTDAVPAEGRQSSSPVCRHSCPPRFSAVRGFRLLRQ
jgi:N-acetylglucosamine malate deacetylase 1